MNRTHPILETDRLCLRRLSMGDLDAVAELYADPEVMRYIGAGGPRTREVTRIKLQELIDAEARQGFGMWATIERETGRFIGECGLSAWDIEGRREVEVAYLLARAYWGRGLATEAAGAIRDYAFEHLSRKRLISLIYHANEASAKVATKVGMRLERDVHFMGHTVGLWSIEDRPPAR